MELRKQPGLARVGEGARETSRPRPGEYRATGDEGRCHRCGGLIAAGVPVRRTVVGLVVHVKACRRA